ncbi:phosphoadenosine phosphosulfate reductase [Anaerostipes hadrus]|uniref:phosphoadenosine phosphosulfate reductase n=1 Tax=Anaerostipes hadrus TaxID=649756 RepID=UPI0035671C53
MKQLKVCWLSAGVSSFIAGYLAKNVNKYIYIDIENQHEDSMRFIKDCEKVLGKDIEILKSPYRNVQNVILSQRYVNGPGGAKCTQILKRRVRKEWEYQYRDYDITYVWGFDVNEKKRADRLLESMPEFKHEFPLIDKGFTKSNSHALLERLGIKRPKMYDLGYSNNNCVGCVKGGMGYWNKIRKDFPEVFKRMAEIEREIGHSCIKGIFLDQLDPNRGRANEVIPDCGIACQLALDKEV